jgi:putative membrane protein
MQPHPIEMLAYHGLPQPTAGSVLTAWTVDPVALLILITAGGAYLAAVRRVRRAGGSWPVSRSIWFLGLGLGSLLVATMGWPGVYAHVLFSAFTLQTTVLLMVTPLFLAFGRPLTLAAQSLPHRQAGWLSRQTRRRPFRVMSSPMVGPLLVPLAISLVFFTGLLETSLRIYPVYELLHVALLGAGFVLTLPLVGANLSATSVSIAAGLFVGFVELLLDAIPGIVVRLTTHLLAAGYYLGLGRPWPPTPLHDQQFGGAILWFVAETADLPFLLLLLLVWIRTDEREAAAADHALDELHAPPAGTIPGPAGAAPVTAARVPTGEPERFRPWWETNPEVFQDQRAALFRRAAADRDDPAPDR